MSFQSSKGMGGEGRRGTELASVALPGKGEWVRRAGARSCRALKDRLLAPPKKETSSGQKTVTEGEVPLRRHCLGSDGEA